MKTSSLLTGLLPFPLGLLAAAVAPRTTPTPPKPNIVYFLIDDMGYADAGFNGCTDIKTPNFDKFAKVDGEWRFVERGEDLELAGDFSGHLLRDF